MLRRLALLITLAVLATSLLASQQVSSGTDDESKATDSETTLKQAYDYLRSRHALRKLRPHAYPLLRGAALAGRDGAPTKTCSIPLLEARPKSDGDSEMARQPRQGGTILYAQPPAPACR